MTSIFLTLFARKKTSENMVDFPPRFPKDGEREPREKRAGD